MLVHDLRIILSNDVARDVTILLSLVPSRFRRAVGKPPLYALGETPMLRYRIMVVLCLFAVAPFARASEPLIEPSERIVFLGDSITYAGGYVEQLDAYLATKYPDRQYELINMGIPSETACGLSEPYHPFPRPDVNERLGRVLDKMKPKVAIVCYGMNDGIYHPFDDERFAKYKAGINKVIADCAKAGTRVILVTPPPFDPKANPRGVVERDSKKFGWRDIYKNYDSEVLAVYAKWIVDQAKRKEVAATVDVHTPVNAYLAAERKKNPAFKMSGDGVHVNSDGHRAIATAMAAGLGFDDFATTKPNAQLNNLIRSRSQLLRNAWLSHVGHKRPGVKKGKPIAEAEKEAAELTKNIGGVKK